jgi:hypothetical protein
MHANRESLDLSDSRNTIIWYFHRFMLAQIVTPLVSLISRRLLSLSWCGSRMICALRSNFTIHNLEYSKRKKIRKCITQLSSAHFCHSGQTWSC